MIQIGKIMSTLAGYRDSCEEDIMNTLGDVQHIFRKTVSTTGDIQRISDTMIHVGVYLEHTDGSRRCCQCEFNGFKQ